jgi:hypothetical protein
MAPSVFALTSEVSRLMFVNDLQLPGDMRRPEAVQTKVVLDCRPNSACGDHVC